NKCKSCAGVTPLYKPGDGAADLGKRAKASYDVGEIGWQGEIFTDRIAPEGTKASVPLALAVIDDQQNFLGGTTCSDGVAPQGILGLGPKQIALPGTDAYMDAFHAAGAPDIVAFELCEQGGHMWLGGFDPSFTTAAPVYTPMIPASKTTPFYNV